MAIKLRREAFSCVGLHHNPKTFLCQKGNFSTRNSQQHIITTIVRDSLFALISEFSALVLLFHIYVICISCWLNCSKSQLNLLVRFIFSGGD